MICLHCFSRLLAWLALGLGTFAQATILPNPTIINSSQAFPGSSPSYAASNVFDNTTTEYASNGKGVGSDIVPGSGTFIEFDFGVPTTMNRLAFVCRNNGTDVIASSRLIFSTDATFTPGTDPTFTFGPMGSNADGFMHSFTTTTARYVRWDVLSLAGSGLNLGASEIRFLNVPTGDAQIPATAIASATPFSGSYAKENAVNANLGSGAGREYASAGLGNATFVDFDFGQTRTITSFDFFDRLNPEDRTKGFDLYFSNDPTFTTGVTSISYAPGEKRWGFSGTISGNSGNGGGIYTSDNLTLENTTVSGNTALSTGSASVQVGGIYTSVRGATLRHCTVTANTGSAGGGILVFSPVTGKLFNSIITGNTGSNLIHPSPTPSPIITSSLTTTPAGYPSSPPSPSMAAPPAPMPPRALVPYGKMAKTPTSPLPPPTTSAAPPPSPASRMPPWTSEPSRCLPSPARPRRWTSIPATPSSALPPPSSRSLREVSSAAPE